MKTWTGSAGRRAWVAVLLLALLPLAGCGGPPRAREADAAGPGEAVPVVFEDVPGPVTPGEAVRWYIAAQFTRSTLILQLVTTPRLQEELGMDQYPPSFGVSSPWVDRAEIVERQEKEGRIVYTVRFGTATSTGPAGEYTEVIAVVPHEGRYLVDEIRRK